ncbi:MAG: nuclear transport factor 2 family protein [Acidobacteria bacterium]|nr:nuclear transport factor 2 family protein [Acidobacteriota bacterium]
MNSTRSTEEVFEDHLRESQTGSVDDDLGRNYASDAVLLTSFGTFHGHDGVRKAAALLNRQLPDARFRYKVKRTAGEVALLVWDGESDASFVHEGVDSFVIRGGKIQQQTIHYQVKSGRAGT